MGPGDMLHFLHMLLSLRELSSGVATQRIENAFLQAAGNQSLASSCTPSHSLRVRRGPSPNPAMWVQGFSEQYAPSPGSPGKAIFEGLREENVEGHGFHLCC
jgi:hypothetical protein